MIANTCKAYTKAFDKLMHKYSNDLEWKTSVLERRGQAMFLDANFAPSKLNARCQGEVGHIHNSDASGHVLLSFADAREVIAKGWGERHRLTGTALPLGYTMLYVPRNEREIEVMMNIFEAGIEYGKSIGKRL